jgi:hypothetical protein
MIRRLWLIVLFIAVSLGMILFIVFAANEPKRVVTLDDIYALLTTADGQNRLEEMADLLDDIGQAWTLEDMKYFLDSMDTRLAAIENRLEALEARAVDCP